MCGIIGYLGDQEATPVLMDSLRRLEYRGYDSAGVAVLELPRAGSTTHTSVTKSEKKVDDLITKAKAEPDAKKQLGLYNEIEKAVIDEYAVIVPIYNREIFLLVKPRVKDLIITGLDAGIRGDYNLWRTYIAK